jgi:AraC-like DNA-binding protein
MARPKKPIDIKAVEALAGLGLGMRDITHVLGVHERTLQRRFAGALQKGRASVKSSLLRRQFEIAMGGNVTMLIWMGKQLLGQSDKRQIGLESTDKLKELADAVMGGLEEADDDDE